MADDFIGREDAIYVIDCTNTFTFTRKRTIEKLRAIPAADVRPVVHARWVHGEYGPYCSNCDGYPPTRKRSGHPGETEFDYTKFCPSCGAKMEALNDD